MATRRTSATARRLVEGQSYELPLPRTTRRISRLQRLVSRQMVQTNVFTNGQMVPVGEPRPAEKQKVQVGSIVSLKADRRSAVRGMPEVGSEYHNYTARFAPAQQWIVNAISNDGKVIRVVPMVPRGSYSSLRVVRDGAGVPVFRGYTGNETMLRSEIESELRCHYSVVTSNDDLRTQGQLARVSAIQKFHDVEDFPEELYSIMWAHFKRSVTAGLWNKLATQAAANRNEGAPKTVRHYQTTNRLLRKATAKNIRVYLKALRSEVRADQPEEYQVQAICEDIKNALADVLPRGSDDRMRDLLEKFSAKHSVVIRYSSGCRHYHLGESVTLHNRYSADDFCPVCAEGSIEVTLRDGETARARRGEPTYAWSDGTRRFYSEPGIIGGRHSGKGIVGFIPSLANASRSSMITLGMELEMQAVNTGEREILARQLRARLSNLLVPAAHRRYCHFEEDGSTGPGGFEMVTGYTDLATHAQLLGAMFSEADGSSPWKGKLRSHDAKGGSCGIHVHIQKPTSLVHATKMRYFINSPASEKLIRDVARRYNDGFAVINNRLVEPNKMAVEMIRKVKYGANAKTTPQHKRMALDRINDNSRYEALNFQNANTVEFRLFRGTTTYQSMMACLEFTQAVWLFTRDTAATSLTVENFVQWVNRADNRKDTANLRKYLARKGWDMATPKVKAIKAEPAASAEQAVTV